MKGSEAGPPDDVAVSLSEVDKGPAELYGKLLDEFRTEANWRAERFQATMRSDIEQAAQFARELLKSMVILHGGSIALLPALFQWGRANPTTLKVGSFSGVFLAGSLGLLFAIIGLLCAYLMLRTSAKCGSLRIQEQQYASWQHVYLRHLMMEQADESEEEARRLEAEIEQQEIVAWRWESTAIFFVVAATVMFLVLVIIAYDILEKFS